MKFQAQLKHADKLLDIMINGIKVEHRTTGRDRVGRQIASCTLNPCVKDVTRPKLTPTFSNLTWHFMRNHLPKPTRCPICDQTLTIAGKRHFVGLAGSTCSALLDEYMRERLFEGVAGLRDIFED